jgi:hypothetical protein
MGGRILTYPRIRYCFLLYFGAHNDGPSYSQLLADGRYPTELKFGDCSVIRDYIYVDGVGSGICAAAIDSRVFAASKYWW